MSSRQPLFRVLWNSKITLLLILANVAVYGVSALMDTRAFESLSYNSFLIDWGANVPPLTLGGEPWRLFTSMFLHVGLAHLAMNMLALWSLGLVLEPRMRWPVFLGVYLLAGLCGSLTTALWNREDLLISCGASGAILGLFGAAVIYALRDRGAGRPHFPLRNLAIGLALTFGAGTVFSIDNAAHAGGLVAGLLLAIIAVLSEGLRPAAAAALLSAGGLAAAGGLAYAIHATQDPELQRQLVLADLVDSLNKIGLGEPARAIDLQFALNDCLDRQLRALYNEGSNAVEPLQQCKTASGPNSSLLPRFMPAHYALCRSSIAALRPSVAEQAGQDALTILDRFCTVQTELYDVVFGDAKTIDVKAAFAARQAAFALMNGSPQLVPAGGGQMQWRTPPTVSAMRNILGGGSELAYAARRESGCPYWNCRR